jgi:hypothetical protein
MNISSVKAVAGFQEYKSKAKKTETVKEPRQTKTDTVELSNTVPPERMASYLDGSFLDDPKFDKLFEAMVNEILN